MQSLSFALVSFFLSSPFVGPSQSVILTQVSQLQTLTFDYIIVGGAYAFGHKITKLTSSSLCIPSSASDQGMIQLQAPFIAPQAAPHTAVDWNYTVIPQSGLQERTFPYPRGRVLGGTSSINYLFQQYGSSEDWDRISRVVGDAGWAWSNMRQYIQKTCAPADGHNTSGQFIPSLHGSDGVFPVSLPGFNQSIDSRVIATTRQLAEFPFNPDMSGGDQSLLGVGFLQSSSGGGIRSSSASTYLAQANSRPNLTVLINVTVLKLVQSGTANVLKSFRSVQFSPSPQTPSTIVTARKEVILSAGAIGTPQILLLSGIGSSTDLKTFNITALIDNSSVGGSLIDSPFLPNVFSVGQDTLDTILRNSTLFGDAMVQWVAQKTGLLADSLVNTLGWARLPTNSTIFTNVTDPAAGPNSPHYEFIPTCTHHEIYPRTFFIAPNVPFPTDGTFLTMVTTLSCPTSRGNLKLSSANPFDKPLIDPRYLTTDFDIFAMRESVKAVMRFLKAPAWSDYDVRLTGPLINATTDSTIDTYVRTLSSSVFHPAGTAMMTSTTLTVGVVNPDLTVKGADGLRVVDASVFPFLPSTHPQGAIYLLAERASDIIKGLP
ncbi:hypothetical protein BDZ97DRAFT_1901272 [Flammula alnicola]|nr:hypothetical protein BDZ97DRAFT_1901272 [Flammula alnicola]